MSVMQDRLVLVVGAPRSGTTWVQRALGAHSDILTLPSETHLFSSGLSVLRDQVQGGLLSSPATGGWFMPREEFTAAARAFCDAALDSYARRARPEAKRVVERSPTHVWHLGLIASVYPDAWVVHVLRDGRDVVRSQVSQSWGTADIEVAAAQWAGAVRSARAAEVPRYLEVRYEQLLADPSSIREVFDFIGLDPLHAALSQSGLESGRAVNVDPTRPDVAIGKWRRDWDAADLATFDRVALDTLLAAGYAAEPATGRRAVPGRAKAIPPRRRPKPLHAEQAQRLVDRLLEELAHGETTGLSEIAVPAVVVRLARGDERSRLLGAEALAQLELALHVEGPWGTPVRGEQLVAGRTWSLVVAHRDPAGDVVERLVQLSFTPELEVSEVRVTRFG